jgi:hypothetical protein
VTVNAGATQRSVVDAMTVRFGRPVAADAGTFEVVRVGGPASGPITVTAISPDGGTTYRLAFAGPDVVNGSVPDGVYELRVRATALRAPGDDGSAAAAAAADQTITFPRLFGDSDGDRDGLDSRRFRAALATEVGMPAYNPIFDYDADGDVDGLDSRRFRARLATEI